VEAELRFGVYLGDIVGVSHAIASISLDCSRASETAR
jgi:hypothetical protein